MVALPPHEIEQVASFGIFAVALLLGVLTFLAWRRERDRRMLIVTAAYALFTLRGLLVLSESFLASYVVAENLEHFSSFLVLFGLLLFFAAVAYDPTNR